MWRSSCGNRALADIEAWVGLALNCVLGPVNPHSVGSPNELTWRSLRIAATQNRKAKNFTNNEAMGTAKCSDRRVYLPLKNKHVTSHQRVSNSFG